MLRAVADFSAANTFHIPARSYSQQYAHIYFARLSALRNAVAREAARKWASRTPRPRVVARVLDVVKSEVCIVIGTLYCDMPLKPNIMDEVAAENNVLPQPPRAKYVSDRDEYVIEDETGRVKLNGDLLRSEGMVTGVVIGVLGREVEGGEFHVMDICFPGIPPQKNTVAVNEANYSIPNEKFLAIVSGLQIGSTKPFSIQSPLLFDFLCGDLGGEKELNLMSRVARIIFAGNLLMEPSSTATDTTADKSQHNKKQAAEFASHSGMESLRHFDEMLSELCTTVEVDIFPGENDPSNLTMPQQSLHPSLLPQSRQWNSFHSATNPHVFTINDLFCIGTAGQPLNDLYRNSHDNDRLALLEKTLHWRHMAPTAPDTLACYPFDSSDPFILNECPNIYFAGNQSEFGTRLVAGPNGQQVRLILVPSFADTGKIVLVGLSTLQAFTIDFDGSIMG